MSGELFVVGLSWRTAPVALREKLAFRDDELGAAVGEFLSSPLIAEAVILSTCNRVQVFGATVGAEDADSVTSAAAVARRVLLDSRGVDSELLAGKMFEHTDDDATRHTFRVASALDSMVVGETQILGQLKAAYGAAFRAGAVGPILGRCMERAFGVAKRVRSETGIGEGAANVSSVAVQLARRVFGDLSGKDVLVVGAGKMSAASVRHLRSDGAGNILVTNRSPEKAEALAVEVDGVARPWDQLDKLLTIADVVISSTAAEQPVLTKRLFKRVTKVRRYEPLVVIDIAVPRDAEPAIGRMDGVYLFDIDDLERVVASNLKERAKEAEAAQRLIDAEVPQFRRWLLAQRAVPTIRSLRHHFSTVARAEVEKALQGMPDDLPREEREKIIRRLGDVIVNKLLHLPLTALKTGDQGDMDALLTSAQRLFNLPREDEEEASLNEKKEGGSA